MIVVVAGLVVFAGAVVVAGVVVVVAGIVSDLSFFFAEISFREN